MKNKLTVTALGLALAGGSLSAQLNPPSALGAGDVFHDLNAAMFQAQGGLYVPDAPGNVPTLPTSAAVFNDFSFTFSGGFSFTNPVFTQGSNVIAGPEETSLYFQLIQPNTTSFVAFGEFDIGFFGENAGIRNRVYVRDVETTPATDTLYFDFSVDAGVAPETDTALSYRVSPQATPSEFFIWNQHLGPTPQPSPPGNSNWQPQGSEFHWRIFKLTGSSGDLAEAFTTGALGDFRNPDGGFYVLLLDDRFPEDQDWDDGMILLGGLVAEVPEPSVIGLAAVVGLGGLIWFRRRKNSKAS